jgi:hypothetical protein
MRLLSALFVFAAIVLAFVAAPATPPASFDGQQVRATQSVQNTAPSPAIAKSRIKIGCKRGLPVTTPTPCSGGHAALNPLPDMWPQTAAAHFGPDRAHWPKPYRPNGVLDPPRSV